MATFDHYKFWRTLGVRFIVLIKNYCPNERNADFFFCMVEGSEVRFLLIFIFLFEMLHWQVFCFQNVFNAKQSFSSICNVSDYERLLFIYIFLCLSITNILSITQCRKRVNSIKYLQSVNETGEYVELLYYSFFMSQRYSFYEIEPHILCSFFP